MKRLGLFLLIMLILSLLFIGCAQFCGTAPESETGGGDDGYGNSSSPSSMLFDTNSGDLCGYGLQDFEYWRI